MLCPPAAAFENLAGVQAVRELGQALPGAMQPVTQAVQAAAKNLPALATLTPGAQEPQKLSELQQVSGMAAGCGGSHRNCQQTHTCNPKTVCSPDTAQHTRCVAFNAFTMSALDALLQHRCGRPR